MKTPTKTINAAVVAVILYTRLGFARKWEDFLADNIRGKQSINGYTLMPCARLRDNRTLRPVYSLEDVKQFIENVLAAQPYTPRPSVRVLNVDDSKGWRYNKFARDGSAVAMAGALLTFRAVPTNALH